jgi:hypothetical protein
MGLKKILMFIADFDKTHDEKFYTGGLADPKAAFPGWPMSDTGHWELRPAYVYEQVPILEKLGRGYCYSRRVYYVDKQTWSDTMAGTEGYDREGLLWKSEVTNFSPHDLFEGVRAYTAQLCLFPRVGLAELPFDPVRPDSTGLQPGCAGRNQGRSVVVQPLRTGACHEIESATITLEAVYYVLEKARILFIGATSCLRSADHTGLNRRTGNRGIGNTKLISEA